jgi:hypothetical protein
MKNKLIVILAILVLGGGFFVWQKQKSKPITVDLPVAQDYQDFTTSTKEDSKDEVEKNEEKVLEVIDEQQIKDEIVKPEIKNINLNVPFTSQAPLSDWSQPWQDACEEASILMVDYYYQNKSLPAKEEVSKLLKDMVDWQEKNWSGHYNLSTAQVAEYVKFTFNYDTEIIENLTSEKLKFYLDKGQPIIIPADGKKLANPNFKNGGPVYHMLVVKGYVGDNFITNDPGTRLGADFIYSSENLLDSIADWNQKESQSTGPKNGLIIFP